MYYNGFKPNRVPYKRTVAPWARKTEVAPDAAVVAKVRGMSPAIEARTFLLTGIASAPAEQRAKEPEIKHIRDQAKPANFGFWGGMGANSFLNDQIEALCYQIAKNREAFGVNSVMRGLAAEIEKEPDMCATVAARFPLHARVRARVGSRGERAFEGAVCGVELRDGFEGLGAPRPVVKFKVHGGACWAYPENVEWCLK